MPFKKTVTLDSGLLLGSGLPKVCVPVIGRNENEFLHNVHLACVSKPDLIELRIDCLPDCMEMTSLPDYLQTCLKEVHRICPAILTYRTEHDGGNGRDGLYLSVLEHILNARLSVDLLDIEINAGHQVFDKLCNLSHLQHIPVIASWHNFGFTPAADELVRCFETMQTWHADIAKIAVMPETPDDVSVLCCAAQTADRLLSIPHIAISMGPLGTKTRTECERFGSCLTFASAGSASAPGQISVDAVRAALIQTHEEQKG